MLRLATGVFVVLHGLVHLWYVVLAQDLVEFRLEMGWTARSWLLSPLLGEPATVLLATVLFVAVAAAFVAGGVGFLVETDWWRPVLLGAAVASTAVILVFWQGGLAMAVQKGVLGAVINLAIVGLVASW